MTQDNYKTDLYLWDIRFKMWSNFKPTNEIRDLREIFGKIDF